VNNASFRRIDKKKHWESKKQSWRS